MKPVRAFGPDYLSFARPSGPAAKYAANTLAPAQNTTARPAATAKTMTHIEPTSLPERSFLAPHFKLTRLL
jgi:hypothetical protein